MTNPERDKQTAPHVGVTKFLALMPPLMFVGFGVMLITIGLTSYRRTKITQTWPSTEGTVYATNIRKYNDEGTIRFAPEVEYQYKVDGQAYKSNVIRAEVFVSFLDENEARQFLESYAAASNVKVFYDPATPRRAVLEAKAAPVLHFVTLMGVVSCGFAIIMYCFLFRQFRRR